MPLKQNRLPRPQKNLRWEEWTVSSHFAPSMFRSRYDSSVTDATQMEINVTSDCDIRRLRHDSFAIEPRR